MADVYITKSDLEGLVEVRVDGRSPLDAKPSVRETLEERLGRDVAELFAEPVVTRGNGAVATSISWYGARDGQAMPLTALDPAARAGAEALLRDRLGKVAGLLGSPEVGPLLGGALYMASQSDVLVIDGQPVITKWGLIPEAAMRSPSARDAHFAATLGPYCDLKQAPPLDQEDWRARHAPAGAATTAGLAAGAAAAGAGAGVAGCRDRRAGGCQRARAAPAPDTADTAAGRRWPRRWWSAARLRLAASRDRLRDCRPGPALHLAAGGADLPARADRGPRRQPGPGPAARHQPVARAAAPGLAGRAGEPRLHDPGRAAAARAWRERGAGPDPGGYGSSPALAARAGRTAALAAGGARAAFGRGRARYRAGVAGS